jgi:hypothetical protein
LIGASEIVMPHELIPIGPTEALGSVGTPIDGSPGLVGCAELPAGPLVGTLTPVPVPDCPFPLPVPELVVPVPGTVPPGAVVVVVPGTVGLVGVVDESHTGHGSGPSWSLPVECRHAQPASAWSAAARVIAALTNE